jgi:lysophospholipase
MTASALARRHSLPAGGTVAMRAMADGWPVRTAIWPGSDPARGSILLLNGRGDFIEKYAETLHDLVDAGWGVATCDWRGQGLSGRLGDTPEKGHCDSFAPWLDDLGGLIAWFQGELSGPYFAIGHSMGGHLLLRHLAREPGDFARVALVSPMLGMLAPPWGPRAAEVAARIKTLLGQGGDYIAGGGPRIKAAPGSERQLLLTSDPERYGDEAWWAEQSPAVSMGSATWGWLAAAFASLAVVRRQLAKVTTPLLVLIPANDRLVDNAATRAAVQVLPDARLEVFEGAGHELLREADARRAAVLARLTLFFETGA